MTAPIRSGEATRQRLLRAALELYTSVGFRSTTTPMIAERAGVAEGTIYRHFGSKEELLNEAYRASQRWATGLLAELRDSHPGGAGESLRRLGRRIVEGAERDPAAVRMVLHCREERHLDERSRESAREFRAALQEIVAAGKSDGVIRAGPADLWASLWLAMIGFAAERVGSREWGLEHPQLGLALEAAWDAIAARRDGSQSR
jgi:AcrR family transcriptional regulator